VKERQYIFASRPPFLQASQCAGPLLLELDVVAWVLTLLFPFDPDRDGDSGLMSLSGRSF